MHAEVRLWDRDGLQMDLSCTVAFGYFHAADTNFGAGRPRDGATTLDWGEGYIKPKLTASFDTGKAGSFYGGFGYVGTATRGDGDAGDFTPANTTALDNEYLYIGWRSGALLPALGTDALDLSFGRQEFEVGDGFLIWDGNFDTGNEGTYRLLARRSFERAALLRLNTRPLRGDVFYLQADGDNGRPQLAGGNVEYTDEELGTIATTYFNIFDASKEFATRNGLNVFSIRGRGNPLAGVGLHDALVASEYAYERNDHPGREVTASAWYLQAGYTFTSLPWSPGLRYRYAVFSGDDPHTATSEAFDPLFYSYGTGWDTWIQGEIVGSYMLFNSNQEVHMLHAYAQPAKAVDLGAMYWRFSLEQPSALLTSFKNAPFTHAASARAFADEIDAYADWTVDEHLSFSGVMGVVIPETAALQAFGRGAAYELLEVYVTLTL